jgi:hypothetical protein
VANCQSQSVKLTEKDRALLINKDLEGTELHRGMMLEGEQNTPFRISPDPFFIDRELYEEIEALGPHLVAFYQAANRLYLQSVRGSQPDWVRDYLERGKSETVLDYQRMRRFRTDLPVIIRPDVIPTDDGIIVSELDSVPGGFGLLAALSQAYARLGFDLVGGANGIVEGFWQAVSALARGDDDPFLAIVVSDESDAYRGEMQWLSDRLRALGRRAVTVHPRELIFTEDGLFAEVEGQTTRIDVLYRFFELFDLKNIPKIDLILYAIRKELVQVTPPLKSHLEEKLWMALLHHGSLRSFWLEQLGRETYELLRRIFPMSWVMDARPLPPHAQIPGLEVGGLPVVDWNQLKGATQRERELVIKPSGFSPTAWGSRGVKIGHDLPQDEWAQGIDEALQAFETTPHVLQRFHKGRRFEVRYFDFASGEVKPMPARVRLCPYFFVYNGEARLGGILATAVSLDKKIIHGMSEAVMAPVAVR